MQACEMSIPGKWNKNRREIGEKTLFYGGFVTILETC
jgi:hypothetical protein